MTTGRDSRVVVSGIEVDIKLVVVERVEVCTCFSRYVRLSGCMRSISARANHTAGKSIPPRPPPFPKDELEYACYADSLGGDINAGNVP